MKSNTLLKILQYKKIWIQQHKIQKPLLSFYHDLKKSKKNFKKSIIKNNPAFIFECKKASPSQGLLRSKFSIPKIINIYNKYANAISVITENKFFKGSFEDLKNAAQYTNKPILCKDFFIDPYQIYYARYHQADAILLMMSILSDSQYVMMTDLAKKMNMHILTEVHNHVELNRALLLNAEIIGINNRNLKDLSINLKTTIQIAPLIPLDRIIISESGINNYKKIRMLSSYVNGFLIGTHLMKSSNLDTSVRSIVYGYNKVCGLTRMKDAFIAEKSGCIYGGFIFYNNSPRYIKRHFCKKIINQVKLKYVGVFVNARIDDILLRVIQLSLSVVQLHGHENQEYIQKLRDVLPHNVKIWKALSVQDSFPTQRYCYVDRYLIDNKNGGTGSTFNWNLIKKHDVSKIILAGGLTLQNIFKASTLGFYGLDFNSGIEKMPGIKDSKKIIQTFNLLKNFPLRSLLTN
ncbi:bifunctional indole-3-glycerol-phosphate synthase TrpC/phosphoribosylanthranilate isomerase TrpF [Buchnera aphidicola]|uniref:bifunctional indole-3-glycerol-phosphate synthase TrpC/phosphoribosylanthranilate isomerase TrpF n=1 Tax=Buchnera aphidicola TaxID=9 RepID=UPI00094C3376|nr:bifunctional indole-3-glycerol-phosphate synthase TrpC/phosphoribosylanthranilate isomerase TrpF [Buchnera aphidicola]